MMRREFLGRSALLLGGLQVLGGRTAGADPAGDAALAWPRGVFTKGLEKLPFDELAATLAKLGVRTIEAPVRRGGHVEPMDAAEKLPALVAALAKSNITIQILTTEIGMVDQGGEAEALLRAAVKLGIRRYRLSHLRYKKNEPLPKQLDRLRGQLKELAALNAQLGIQGQYQNHRGGDYVGGPIWDMLGLLDGVDPAHLGLAFDFAHATVEGTNAWELNFRRAAPQVVAVYFKDYKITNRTSSPVPLGQGSVDRSAARLVRELLPASTPVSLHVEYAADQASLLAGIQQDMATLDGWFA